MGLDHPEPRVEPEPSAVPGNPYRPHSSPPHRTSGLRPAVARGRARRTGATDPPQDGWGTARARTEGRPCPALVFLRGADLVERRSATGESDSSRRGDCLRFAPSEGDKSNRPLIGLDLRPFKRWKYSRLLRACQLTADRNSLVLG